MKTRLQLASVPGSHPAFHRLQYGVRQATKSWMRAWDRTASGEKLDECLDPKARLQSDDGYVALAGWTTVRGTMEFRPPAQNFPEPKISVTLTTCALVL